MMDASVVVAIVLAFAYAAVCVVGLCRDGNLINRLELWMVRRKRRRNAAAWLRREER